MKLTKVNRTAQAVLLVKDGGLSGYAAAKQVGVDPGSVYRALKRAKERGTCSHCGKMLPLANDAPAPSFEVH